MKMWICRDKDNTLWLSEGEPYLDEEKGEWNFRSGNYMLLSKEKFPEVAFENSPMEVELRMKQSGLRLSPMFRLLDMIVIKDTSDRKRIVAYTKKLIEKLKEEGFNADARVVEDYLRMFNGEPIAMATMDEVELKLIEK